MNTEYYCCVFVQYHDIEQDSDITDIIWLEY